MRAATAALVLAWTFAASAEAQTATAPAVKAAFLYNFAKFAGWPADVLAPGAPLSFCVLGDAAVAAALEQAIKGRAIEGHKLMAHAIKAESPIRRCHVLYVGGVDSKQFAQLLESARDAPVFTVGDGGEVRGTRRRRSTRARKRSHALCHQHRRRAAGATHPEFQAAQSRDHREGYPSGQTLNPTFARAGQEWRELLASQRDRPQSSRQRCGTAGAV